MKKMLQSKKQKKSGDDISARDDLYQFTVLQETEDTHDSDFSARDMETDPTIGGVEDAASMGAIGTGKAEPDEGLSPQDSLYQSEEMETPLSEDSIVQNEAISSESILEDRGIQIQGADVQGQNNTAVETLIADDQIESVYIESQDVESDVFCTAT